MLEARTHERTSFLTVTYDQEHVPFVLDVDCCPLGTLDPEHHRMFIRRLRGSLGGPRWFGVGEYGGRFGRPHFHYLVFGRPADSVADAARECWTAEDGTPLCDPRRVTATDAVQERLAYMAGYTVDKLKRRPEELGPRHPEFMRQSLRPAIGLSDAALAQLVVLSTSRGGKALQESTLDVPREVRVNGRVWPIDRAVRDHWRAHVGLPRVDPRRPQAHTRNPTADELSYAQAVERKLSRNKRGTL